MGVGFGSWWCSGDMGPWLWLGIDLVWGRGYGDNAGGGVEISFRWVLMGVDFSLIFCGFLCMVVVGVLLPW